MRAEELMIGSIVSLTEDKTPMPCAIAELRSDTVLVRPLGCKDCEAVGYNQIFPIPLTAEILEKNEWEIYQASDGQPMYHTLHLINCVLEYYWHLHRLTISPYDAEPWVKIVNSSCVHQLQHALRLCGLNDLATNFEI